MKKLKKYFILFLTTLCVFQSFSQQKDTTKAGTIKVQKNAEVVIDTANYGIISVSNSTWVAEAPCSDTAVLSLKLSYLAGDAIKEEKFIIKSVNTKCAKFPNEIIRSYVAGYKSKNSIADTCKIYVDEIKAVQRSTGKAVNLKAQVFKNKRRVKE